MRKGQNAFVATSLCMRQQHRTIIDDKRRRMDTRLQRNVAFTFQVFSVCVLTISN